MYAGGNDINDGRSPDQVAADFRRFVDTVRQALPVDADRLHLDCREPRALGAGRSREARERADRGVHEDARPTWCSSTSSRRCSTPTACRGRSIFVGGSPAHESRGLSSVDRHRRAVPGAARRFEPLVRATPRRDSHGRLLRPRRDGLRRTADFGVGSADARVVPWLLRVFAAGQRPRARLRLWHRSRHRLAVGTRQHGAWRSIPRRG